LGEKRTLFTFEPENAHPPISKTEEGISISGKGVFANVYLEIVVRDGGRVIEINLSQL